MKQTEYEDFFYLLKFPESQDYVFKKYQAHNLSRVLYYSKEDYSYIALPLTKAGAVTILMEYTRAPKGIEQVLVTQ